MVNVNIMFLYNFFVPFCRHILIEIFWTSTDYSIEKPIQIQ